VEEFRLHYTLVGSDALTQAQDRDGNGVPDRVEEAALQLVAARRVYTERLGFVHPLQQPRYRGIAQVIEVDMRVVGPGKTGRAYDEVRSAHPGPDGAEACALRIDLDPRWAPPNLTPAHELFHLVQNGYTMFKMPWLTEGTARWAESALGSGTVPTAPLPASAAARDALLGSSYGAAAFWGRLVATLDGAPVIRTVLEAMGRADKMQAQEHHWPPYAWTEAEQRSSANDAYAWGALLDVLRAVPQPSAELVAFLSSEAAEPPAPSR
jgi:hypothetical protein